MLRKILYAVGLATSFFIAFRSRQTPLYSDTAFVPPGSYTNNQSPDVINHLEQQCVYEVGSVSSYPSSYLRFCEIREGEFRQKCHGNGYDTATCFEPEVIKHGQPDECQRQFIHERFSETKSSLTSFSKFSNCAKGKYPKKTARDKIWESEHISPDEISYSTQDARHFKLTRN